MCLIGQRYLLCRNLNLEICLSHVLSVYAKSFTFLVLLCPALDCCRSYRPAMLGRAVSLVTRSGKF